MEDMDMTVPGGGGDLLYRLNDRDEFVFVNEAWNEFASANGGDALVAPLLLGRPLWGFITDATTRQLYHDLLKRVRSGRPVQFQFRCDTPSLRRLLEMDVAVAPGGTTEFRTRVISEELREYQALLEPDRLTSDEFLHMCAWCKQVDIGAEWVEVEEAVALLRLFEQPLLPQLTHGICQACYAKMMKVLEEPGAIPEQAAQPPTPVDVR